MDFTLNVVLILVGFVALLYGAALLVRGSSSLARSLGVTPMVVGLTVVAFGTSAPELVVSLVSSLRENGMMAVGNAVGSNICNIGLVLGLAAACRPLSCGRSVVSRDIPVMLMASLFVLLLLSDGDLGRVEGIVLLVGIVLYTLFNYAVMREEARTKGIDLSQVAEPEEVPQVESRKKQILLILVGIIGVAGGAHLVVESAVVVMERLHVSPKFIGLTVFAFGTSLPELATSVVAAIRKETDISIGNLVGSNVFNILSVIGAAAAANPIVVEGGLIDSGLAIDFSVMIVVSFLPWLMMRRDYTVGRLDGLFLLTSYLAYLTYLITKAG